MTDEDLGDFEPDGQANADVTSEYEATVKAALEGIATRPMPGGIAFDLVTRQPLLVNCVKADTLEEYYREESFDLATYKMHAFLPVRADDRVLECVYISEITAESLHKWGKQGTYDFPEGRLAHVPVELAWTGAEVGDV